MEDEEAYAKIAKLGQLGNRTWVTWPTFKFLDPLYNSATRKDRDFKFHMILLSTPYAHLGLFSVIKQQISNTNTDIEGSKN